MVVSVNYKGQTQNFPDYTTLKDIRGAWGFPFAGVLKLTNANTLTNAINLPTTTVPGGTYDFVIAGDQGIFNFLLTYILHERTKRPLFRFSLSKTFRESLRNAFFVHFEVVRSLLVENMNSDSYILCASTQRTPCISKLLTNKSEQVFVRVEVRYLST